LKVIAKYSQNIFELILYNYNDKKSIEFLPEELDSFFISWTNRISQKSLSLVVINRSNSLDKNNENIEIIKKNILN